MPMLSMKAALGIRCVEFQTNAVFRGCIISRNVVDSYFHCFALLELMCEEVVLCIYVEGNFLRRHFKRKCDIAELADHKFIFGADMVLHSLINLSAAHNTLARVPCMRYEEVTAL